MNYRKEDLKKIEASINTLQDKATRINNKIKKFNGTSNLNDKFTIKENNISKNLINSENKSMSIEKLEIEILKLKKKQDILTITLYVISLLFIFSLLAIYELKIF